MKLCLLLSVCLLCSRAASATRPVPDVPDGIIEDMCVHDCVDMCNTDGDGGVLPGPRPAKLTIVCYLDGPVRTCNIV